MGVLFSMRHRGAGGAAARARSIVARFGVTASPMEERLRRFDELTAEFGVRPSWAITACILDRNRRAMQRFAERGVEFAIHGLVHDDHSLRSLDEQRTSIARAAELFRAAGVPYRGFRCPFLRGNSATDEVVRDLGLLYHSTQPVVFDTAPALGARAEEAFRRTLRHLYSSALDADTIAVRPSLRSGVIHIPVALPDDEIMVERLRLDEEQQTAVWLGTLDATWQRGELFTVQLHPERTDECAAALAATLAEARARRPAVWIATLERIAEWWRRRARTKLEVMPLEDGRYRVRMEGDPAATLLAGSTDVGLWITKQHRRFPQAQLPRGLQPAVPGDQLVEGRHRHLDGRPPGAQGRGAAAPRRLPDPGRHGSAHAGRLYGDVRVSAQRDLLAERFRGEGRGRRDRGLWR